MHSCTEEELDNFYPINDSSKQEFETNVKRALKCFDHSKLKLAGAIESSIGSMLNVKVKIKKIIVSLIRQLPAAATET